VPIVGRAATGDREAVRRELGLQDGQVMVLAVLRGEPLTLPRCGPRVVLYGFGEIESPCVRTLDEAWQERYTDLLAACDVVLSKIGYGVISECILSRRPLIEVPRFGFAETALVREAMRPYLPSEQLSLEDLRAGRLEDVALRLTGQQAEHRMESNGPETAARRILDLCT